MPLKTIFGTPPKRKNLKLTEQASNTIGQQKRAGNQDLVLQFIACSDQARSLGDLNIRWQIPERHRFGRRKAFPDLSSRQVGLDKKGLVIARRHAAGVDARLFKPPVTRLETGALGLDALQRLAGGSKVNTLTPSSRTPCSWLEAA
jgi:hypothetical protein